MHSIPDRGFVNLCLPRFAISVFLTDDDIHSVATEFGTPIQSNLYEAHYVQFLGTVLEERLRDVLSSLFTYKWVNTTHYLM